MTGKVTLRPVQDSDDDFLLKVYGSTREQEMAQVPWTSEQKQQFVRMQWEAQKIIMRRSILKPATRLFALKACRGPFISRPLGREVSHP